MIWKLIAEQKQHIKKKNQSKQLMKHTSEDNEQCPMARARLIKRRDCLVMKDGFFPRGVIMTVRIKAKKKGVIIGKQKLGAETKSIQRLITKGMQPVRFGRFSLFDRRHKLEHIELTQQSSKPAYVCINFEH